MKEHFDNLVLRHIPGVWDPDKISPNTSRPSLSSSVFVSVKKSVSGVDVIDSADLGRDETLDLVEGSQHMFQYSAISHLLDSEYVQLI